MLDFEKIEDCFPEKGALCAVGDQITVSHQWMIQFADNVARRERLASKPKVTLEALRVIQTWAATPSDDVKNLRDIEMLCRNTLKLIDKK